MTRMVGLVRLSLKGVQLFYFSDKPVNWQFLISSSYRVVAGEGHDRTVFGEIEPVPHVGRHRTDFL